MRWNSGIRRFVGAALDFDWINRLIADWNYQLGWENVVMQNRRRWMKSAAVAALAWIPCQSLFGQQGFGSNRGVPSLTDQLSKGLRASTAQQQLFVQKVVMKVDNGELPRGMVNLVFKWARERNERYPFPYFQYALTVLAKRRGVDLG